MGKVAYIRYLSRQLALQLEVLIKTVEDWVYSPITLRKNWGAPKAIRCHHQDNVIVVDTENHALRRIDAKTGIVTTIAGGHQGGDGDGGPAVDAGLDRPHGCGIDRRGNIYIADGINHRVRVVGVAS